MTDILSAMVIQIRQDNGKIRTVGAESRFFRLLIVDLEFIGADDFSETAAFALHIAQPFKDICQKWIAAC